LTFGSIADFEGEFVPAAPGLTKSGGIPDSSYELQPGDFPFHNTVDKGDRNSPLVITTNDAASSAGVFDSVFGRVRPFGLPDKCGTAQGDVFHAGRHPARQVEPRNTPTTINAVFNHRNFWDGRANNMFNGVGVFGPRDIAGDPNKRLIVLENGTPVLKHLDIRDASLASQAVGPPLSALEMACDGKTFADVGRDLLLARPLRLQKVHPQDSMLGSLAASGRGLKAPHTYASLIMKAFDEKYWAAKGTYKITDGELVKVSSGLLGVAKGGYTQMAINFPMFWGISIMLYEASLISDQSKFDTWFASCRPQLTPGAPATPATPTTQQGPIGNPTVSCADGGSPLRNGMTEQEVLGFGLFNNAGAGIRNLGNPSCGGCHPVTNPNATPLVFPVFSEAQFQAGQTFVPVERSRIDDRGHGTLNIPIPTAEQRAAGQLSTVEGAVHDRGFFNIGSRAASFDLGSGGKDPYGNPLSIARMFIAERRGLPVVDPTGITDPCNTPTLIEGGFPNLAQAPEVNQGRYPGCDGNLADRTDSVSSSFDWSLERELVDGSVKTPSIRNVALTPPYFHYGGYSDLRSVVEFYARGGNHRNKSFAVAGATGDTSGTGPLGKGLPVAGSGFGTNVDFFIRDVNSTDEQIDAIVAFMKTVTDPRVQCDAAPFDHPELPVPNGHRPADRNRDGRADDVMAIVPAVGAGGYQADGRSNFCLPNSGDLFDPNLRNRLTTP
jgi:cytochrome c peroxidase